jgi:hypothetical protein
MLAVYSLGWLAMQKRRARPLFPLHGSPRTYSTRKQMPTDSLIGRKSMIRKNRCRTSFAEISTDQATALNAVSRGQEATAVSITFTRSPTFL